MKRKKMTIKNSCDKLAAKHCKLIGKCEKCGAIPPKVQLQWCHIKSRRYLSTRWHPLNYLCLCAKDHRFFTDHPDEFIRWLDKKYPGRLEELQQIFLSTAPMKASDLEEIERGVKERIEIEERKALSIGPYDF